MGHVAGALLIWRQQDTGGLELSASPHTFGFDAPFENGDVLDGATPFVRQLMQQSQGAVTYGDPPSGRIFQGDYVRLNKVLLMFLTTDGTSISKPQRRAAGAPSQGELFGPGDAGK